MARRRDGRPRSVSLGPLGPGEDVRLTIEIEGERYGAVYGLAKGEGFGLEPHAVLAKMAGQAAHDTILKHYTGGNNAQ